MMLHKFMAAVCIVLVVLFISCSKKNMPQTAAKPNVIYNGNPLVVAPTVTIPVVKKTVVKKATPTPVTKVIIVNDLVAKKNIDGRLYYDVEGHRYWRNYNDGRYYLFNKSMYSDSAFIKR